MVTTELLGLRNIIAMLTPSSGVMILICEDSKIIKVMPLPSQVERALSANVKMHDK